MYRCSLDLCIKLLWGKESLILWIINYQQRQKRRNNVHAICIDMYILSRPWHGRAYRDGAKGNTGSVFSACYYKWSLGVCPFCTCDMFARLLLNVIYEKIFFKPYMIFDIKKRHFIENSLCMIWHESSRLLYEK